MIAAIFQPDPLTWLFGSGIGTNLGAAIVWVPVGAFGAWLWARARLAALHASHRSLHEKLDRIENRVAPPPARPPFEP